jgi:hypothetical protein
MSTDSKAQTHKELMAASKELFEEMERFGKDLKEGRITLEEADTLNKAYAARIKQFNAALRKFKKS